MIYKSSNHKPSSINVFILSTLLVYTSMCTWSLQAAPLLDLSIAYTYPLQSSSSSCEKLVPLASATLRGELDLARKLSWSRSKMSSIPASSSPSNGPSIMRSSRINDGCNSKLMRVFRSSWCCCCCCSRRLQYYYYVPYIAQGRREETTRYLGYS